VNPFRTTVDESSGGFVARRLTRLNEITTGIGSPASIFTHPLTVGGHPIRKLLGTDSTMERKEKKMSVGNLEKPTISPHRPENPNLALVRRYMTTIGEPDWWDLMHENIVLEFPYGPSLGAQERVVGKEEAIPYVVALLKKFGHFDWQDLKIIETTDPNLFIAEYWATLPTHSGGTYKQVYINKLQVQDGRIIGMREFWDPKRIIEANNS
jgi:ketosteroid isomerase-like protein